jgi:hypothetical protein
LVGANDRTAAGTNALRCLLKHGGARDNKFLVTHDWPKSLNFRDHTPKRTDRGVIELLASVNNIVIKFSTLPVIFMNSHGHWFIFIILLFRFLSICTLVDLPPIYSSRVNRIHRSETHKTRHNEWERPH